MKIALKYIAMFFIVILAGFLRFYKLDQIPPSLNWDEVAAGYNAYTIANWGADEYGNKFPIVFRSFGDDKHPVHIYITAAIVKIFGLSDYSTRASSALVGTLAVLAIYFLAKKLFRRETPALFAALFLAVSPYHLQFSRGLWEANFALFFFIAGLALFHWGIEKKNFLIPLSFLSFGISFFSYHSAKVVVPPMVLLLCLTHLRQILENKKILGVTAAIVLIFGLLIIKEPRILGFARVNQTKFSDEVIAKNGGITATYFNNYKKYFTYSYLFESGDQSARASVKVIGEFYKIDLVLSLIGLVGLAIVKKWKSLFILIFWLVLSPIPGALSTVEPSATRGIFMIGPIILLSAYGAGLIVSSSKKRWVGGIVVSAIVIILGKETYGYLNYYYSVYPKKDAIEWQYGMKQIVEYLKENPDYAQVYMDKIRQQPYIFFLYYFKTSLPELLSSVRYDESESKSYNTILSYDKYQFGGKWNIIESYPTPGILYIITPSYYDGLRYKNEFQVKKLVKYPDGSDAFYIVEGKNSEQ